MRVAFIVSEFPKITETFVAREAMAFLEAGHEVRIFHLQPYRTNEVVHDFMQPLLSRVEYEPFLGISTFTKGLSTALRHPFKSVSLFARIIKETIKTPMILLKSLAIFPKSLGLAHRIRAWKADHIHAAFAGHPATAAWIASDVTNIPFSTSCHAHDIFITQSLLSSKLPVAEYVRTISDYNVDFLQKEVPALSADKLHIVRCGIDPDAMHPGPVQTEGTFNVLYVGSLEVRKGVKYLIEALAQLEAKHKDWRCKIIGDGEERKGLEALAQTLGISEKITFLGKRKQNEIFRAFSDSTIAVVPSIVGPAGRIEGIPVVIMECMANERPVIATRLSGIPELVIDGETGFLIPHADVGALTDRLLGAYENRDNLGVIAAAGRAKVEAEYNSKINAKQLVALTVGSRT